MTKIATEVNCATKNCVLPFTVTVIISSAINPSARGMAECEVNLKKNHDQEICCSEFH